MGDCPKESIRDDRSGSLGICLTQHRQIKGLCLEQVVQETGLTRTYLEMLEGDRIHRPSGWALHKLAAVYGISYPELMRQAGNLQPRPANEVSARFGAE